MSGLTSQVLTGLVLAALSVLWRMFRFVKKRDDMLLEMLREVKDLGKEIKRQAADRDKLVAKNDQALEKIHERIDEVHDRIEDHEGRLLVAETMLKISS